MNTESAIVWLAQYKSSAISCRGCLSESTGGEPIDERLGDDAIKAGRIERALKAALYEANESRSFDCLLCVECRRNACNRGSYNRFATAKAHGDWFQGLIKNFRLGNVEWIRILQGEILFYERGNPRFTRQK